MKILFISTKFPWPIRGGREGTIDQYLRILGERDEVILAAFFADQSWPVPGCVRRVYPLPYPGHAEMALGLLRNPFKPIQSHLFNGWRVRREIRRICDTHKPDVIVYDMIRSISLAQDKGVRGYPKIIDMDDLLSRRYRRWLDLRMTNITGSFQGALPKVLRDLIARLARPILQVESRLTRRAESRAFDVFDGAIFVSKDEADEFLGHSRRQGAVAVVPRAVNSTTSPDLRAGDRPSFFFLGNFNTPANLITLRRFDAIVGELDPALRRTARFFAIGAMNKEFAPRHVKALGFVDDIYDHIDDRSVLVAPMVTGTGIKIKIMESLAAGIPVVTNKVGVENLDLPADTYTHCEDDGEYLDFIVRVLSGDLPFETLQARSRAAVAFVDKRFSIDTARANLLGLVDAVVAPGVAAAQG